jgi:predicted ATP-grasp superfamily ATP-dependent carboligase
MEAFLHQGSVISPSCTVLWSIPSQGNIGQLAIDSLLSAFDNIGNLIKLGAIETDCLRPMTGTEQYSDKSAPFLVTPLEIYTYRGGEEKLLFVQQRSPCINGKGRDFARQVLDLVHNTWRCKSLILLAGASTEGLMDEFLQRFS